jgi:D-arabinose 1-dehydrogenase-like Zn-dependent alcohol dehydrogenase
MRAAILNDDHHLEVGEVPDPAPGPGELVLQVTACGICGSDL